mmetsp:Transcript_15318/g.42374  ORF Transcript_15318/g.42374 Transcript_15318/m.42374 type:complete len:205 (+) Transcript_15318:127-741(+)
MEYANGVPSWYGVQPAIYKIIVEEALGCKRGGGGSACFLPTTPTLRGCISVRHRIVCCISFRGASSDLSQSQPRPDFLHTSHSAPCSWGAHNPVRNSLPKLWSLLTAMMVETAALNFLFALNLLNSFRLTPRSFFASDASSPLIHGFCSACAASRRRLGLTVRRDEIRSLASDETVPQYSSWNSYSPRRIFRNKSRWVLSMKGG